MTYGFFGNHTNESTKIYKIRLVAILNIAFWIRVNGLSNADAWLFSACPPLMTFSYLKASLKI
jgi:hypothetical protein